jgi:hypothetical protein
MKKITANKRNFDLKYPLFKKKTYMDATAFFKLNLQHHTVAKTANYYQ